MRILRRKTKVIKIGKVYIGGDNPIAIQSMTKTKTADTEKTIKQIKELEKNGCEIVRLAVRDIEDTKAIRKIKPEINIPLVCDIHFDWRLALAAIDNGADKIRLNPGNIYKKKQIREVAQAAKLNRIPIRVGLNSGSLKKLQAQGSRRQASIAGIMVRGALDYIKILEKFGFSDIVISLKASDIRDTIEAYRKMARTCDYPFHLGMTATGTPHLGVIKSSIAIGTLLLEGIGDTIRMSLTGTPQEEVKAAKCILEASGARGFGPEIISCPTCGRCEVNLVSIVKEVEKKITQSTNRNYRLSTIDYRLPLKVAIMGCVVNGPGEAKEADLGIAFGRNEGLLFRKGNPLRKVSSDKCVSVLLEELSKFKI
jgi:(E)-4-hydroxy-3-methylbut-2-enyl-diphosphate synthase